MKERLKMILIKKKAPNLSLQNELEKKQQILLNTDSDARELFDSDTDLKDLLRRSLFDEQHGLCAYCMSKLVLPTKYSLTRVTIEHYKALSQSRSTVFDYSNLLLVCDGGQHADSAESKKNVVCCDKSRGDEKLYIDPKNQEHIKHLHYTNEGIIYYVNPQDDYENQIKQNINIHLQLNGRWDRINDVSKGDTKTELKKKRKSAFRKAHNELDRLRSEGKCSIREIERLIMIESSNPHEFSGVYLDVYQQILGYAIYKKEKAKVLSKSACD
jgi:uncharacterized protein (TIGR02646 family)